MVLLFCRVVLFVVCCWFVDLLCFCIAGWLLRCCVCWFVGLFYCVGRLVVLFVLFVLFVLLFCCFAVLLMCCFVGGRVC